MLVGIGEKRFRGFCLFGVCGEPDAYCEMGRMLGDGVSYRLGFFNDIPGICFREENQEFFPSVPGGDIRGSLLF